MVLIVTAHVPMVWRWLLGRKMEIERDGDEIKDGGRRMDEWKAACVLAANRPFELAAFG